LQLPEVEFSYVITGYLTDFWVIKADEDILNDWYSYRYPDRNKSIYFVKERTMSYASYPTKEAPKELIFLWQYRELFKDTWEPLAK